MIASIGDVDGTVKCDSAVLESDETDDEINSTLKKTDEDLNALHTVNTLASASNLSVSNQGTVVKIDRASTVCARIVFKRLFCVLFSYHITTKWLDV